MNWYEPLLDRGLFPDGLVRAGIRRRLGARLDAETRGGIDAQTTGKRALVQKLRESPIAIETEKANEQHYELPASFFERVLGPHLKYSCGLWGEGESTLGGAERAMLEKYVERARLEDGMSVLDLGCGWGSLGLYLAERFPTSRVLSVSNSSSQREYIERRAAEKGLTNLEVRTADANTFDPGRTFDRVLSIEMLEHMKNYSVLLKRISSWLEPDGLCFVHIFTHRSIAYEYEPSNDWIGRYFFTGGTMPSDDLLLHFQDELAVVDHWQVDGRHYERTANEWLVRLDDAKADVMPVLEEVYGPKQAAAWFNRWRVFFMACAELWGYDRGGQWIVSHYLFRPRREDAAAGAGQPNERLRSA